MMLAPLKKIKLSAFWLFLGLCLVVPCSYAAAFQAPQVLGDSVYPTGTLVNSNGTIYVISGQVKIPFTNWNAFVGLGYSPKNIINGDLSGYTPAQTYFLTSSTMAHPWGTFISNKGTVYYSTENGLVPISTPEIFLSNGGQWNLVVKANNSDLANLNNSIAPLGLYDNRTSQINQTTLQNLSAPQIALPSLITAETSIPVTASVSNPNGLPLSYIFNWGDGSVPDSAAINSSNHIYNTAGTYSLMVTVTDAAGKTNSSIVQILVAPKPDNNVVDIISPTVSIQSPSTGSTLSGTTSLTANASDNIGVASVQFLIDDQNVGSPISISPYTYSLNTSLLTNNAHTLSARAVDFSGNVGTSGSVMFTINNSTTTPIVPDSIAPSTPTGLASSGVVSSAATISWTAATDNIAVIGYKIYRNNVQIGIATGLNYQDTGLVASTAYTYKVSAYDAAGNNSVQSSAISITTAAASGNSSALVPPTVIDASLVAPTGANFHWGEMPGLFDMPGAGYNIYRNGIKVGFEPASWGPYYNDTNLLPSTKYTYTLTSYDASGNESAKSLPTTITTLASGSGNTYTVGPTDAAGTIYGIIDNAGCGDTVNILPGTYNMASNNLAMIRIQYKSCGANNPYIVKASDPNNLPLFDYTGYPLDGMASPIPNNWTPWEGDAYRGAWQVQDSSYVVVDGVHIKGTTAINNDSIAGLRYIGVDHFTIRRSILEKDWDGLFGIGTNILVEYNQFLYNGEPGSDKQHQFYDSGGDNLTIRYNYFNDENCDSCGQNIHSRSWHSFIYGNWLQSGSDYEWDMMGPNPAIAPSDRTMVQQFYNNVVVTSLNPVNGIKVFTFYNDSLVPNLKMKLDAQGNTFWIRSPGYAGTLSLFQLNNYVSPNPEAIDKIDLSFSNNIVHFSGNPPGVFGSYSLYYLNGTNPWTVSGTNNWFDSFVTNTCPTSVSVSGGTCLLTNSVIAATPPFKNINSLDLRPTNSSHPFGTADISQPLKSSNQQIPPGSVNVIPRTDFSDVGALSP